MASITHTPAWVLNSQNGPSSLEFVESLELPQIGAHDVLVKIHAASLNYREVVIAQVPPRPIHLNYTTFLSGMNVDF